MTKSSGGKWEDEGKKWKEDKGGEVATKEEGSQESKGESEKENKDRSERGEVRRAALSFSFSHCFPSSSSIARHPDRAGNWTWTRLSLFLFLFLCLSLPRGSAPQREPWGPEIADDKIAAAFHSAQGYPTLP